MRWYWRWSLVVVLIGAAALAWMSVLSYCPADPPLYAVSDANEPATQPASQPASQPALVVVEPVPATMSAGDPLAQQTPRIRPDMPPEPQTPNEPNEPNAPAAPPRPTEPVRNAAGIVGAYTAHALLHYVGVGSHVGLALASVWAVVLAVRGRIRAWPLRVTGVVLLVVAVSSAAHLWAVVDGEAGLGPPGALGAAAGGWLESQFAISGGWVVVVVAAIVALILTAERLLLVPIRLAGHTAGALWQALRRARERAAERRKARQAAREQAAKRTATSPGAAEAAPSFTAAATVDAPAGSVQPTAADRSRIVEEVVENIRRRREAAAARPPAKAPQADDPSLSETFKLPAIELLAPPEPGGDEAERDEAARRAAVLQRTLTEFNVSAEVVAQQVGPVITMFELSLAPGVKVSQVAKLEDDLARSLAVGSVRIVSPLPGRDTIGVEVPNRRQQTVRIREIMGREARPMALPVCLGKDAGGDAIVLDLARTPHVLIAGTTGSGKSVCMNAIVVSLLVTRRPADVRFVMVDPKMVEMAAFDELPHLLCPPVSDMARAAEILAWAANKMDERYALLRDAGVRHIADYNNLAPAERQKRLAAKGSASAGRPTRLPYLVVLVDELADLMMTAGKDVEAHIVRIAQKARAVGIHLVLATQRPSVDVVTGLIKSNMPCRISFRVASKVESRIILDQNGADVLLGRGDMLLLRPGTSTPVRAQGTFLDDREIRAVADDLRARSRPCYDPELTGDASDAAPAGAGEGGWGDEHDRAAEAVAADGRGSASQLQRELGVSYARARQVLEDLTEVGILGPHRGPQARECRIDLDDWRRVRQAVR